MLRTHVKVARSSCRGCCKGRHSATARRPATRALASRRIAPIRVRSVHHIAWISAGKARPAAWSIKLSNASSQLPDSWRQTLKVVTKVTRALKRAAKPRS